jgi:hypothetical protein
MKIAFFWYVAPCKSCVNRRFGGTYRIVSASYGSLSTAPSRNFLNMTPDPQGYAGQCTLGSLASGLGSPFSPPPPKLILYRLWSALFYLLAHFYRRYPSTPYWFPMWPTLPPSLLFHIWVYSTGGSVCSHLLTLVPCSRIFLPWDGGDTFLQNVGSHKIYTAPHPRWRHSSCFMVHWRWREAPEDKMGWSSR